MRNEYSAVRTHHDLTAPCAGGVGSGLGFCVREGAFLRNARLDPNDP